MTPPHGTVEDILGSWWEAEKQWVKWVVAYTDEAAHCGEGKAVWNKGRVNSNPHMGMPGGDRFWKEKQLYCSAFLGPYPQLACYGHKAVSLRHLQVGPHVFHLEYESSSSWMSNVGDGTCEVVGVELDKGYHPKIRLPLFAVDFVLGREAYAIDFNVAPGIRGSGVEKVLDGKDACRALEQALEDL